ncbi:MAG: hypothetical protein RSC04_05025 [Bacteroidales bacterium]
MPIYALIWIVALWVGKAYTKPIHVWRIVYGFVGGSVCILLAHALLGAEWHFSRFIIIVGSVLSLGVLLTYRCIGSCFFKTKFAFYSKKHKKYLILGDSQEVERVSSLLVQKGVDLCNIYNIKLNSPLELSYLMLEIVEMERLYKIDEFLFCAKNMSYSSIISLMSTYKHKDIDYKIVMSEGDFMIGSQSVEKL